MKKLLWIAVGIVLTPPLAALIVVLNLDPNRYKPALTELGRELSGREFEIRGDIHLKPALNPTIVVEGVRLGNSAWATHATMLEIGKIEGRLRLWPLLRQEVRIRHLIVAEASLALEQDKNGRGNWAFESAAAASGSGGMRLFDLEQVSIRDSRIEYRHDQGAPVVMAINRASLLPEGPGLPLRLRADLILGTRAIDAGAKLDPLQRLFANEPYAVDLRASSGEIRFEAEGTVREPLSGEGADFNFAFSAPARRLLPDLNNGSINTSQPIRAHGQLTQSDGTWRMDDLVLDWGQSAVNATVMLEPGGKRPDATIKMSGEYLEIPLPEPKTAEPAARLLPTTPLPLGWLHDIDFELAASIAKLKLGNTTLESVRLDATLDNGELDVDKLAALVEQGTLLATLRIDGGEDPPRVRHTLELNNISMTPLVSRAAAKQFRGGRVALELALDGAGTSPAAIAAGADGLIKLSLTDVDIANRGANLAGGDLLLSLFALLNPLSRSDNHDLVECAVFHFPVTDGRAQAATGIGIRTQRLNILGGGTVNLATEAIDIGVNPKAREGLGLSLAGFADFVRIGGTLSAPAPTTDARGAVTGGVKVGAALATGGLSLLAEGLLDRSAADTDVCAVAAGSATLPGAAGERSALERAADTTGDVLEQAGAAVKGTFKRLFGD